MNPTVRYDLLPGEWRPDAPRVSYTADRSQIAALLEEALRAQPWTSGEADAGPSVTVKGRRLSIPPTGADLEWLDTHASDAPYGRGEDTVLDAEVRDARQIGAGDFTLTGPAWDQLRNEMTKAIAADMGLDDAAPRLVALKLLLYREGGHFAEHADTEKTSGMVASAALVLPGEHTGGALRIEHAGETLTAAGGGDTRWRWAAWYADCRHRLEAVEQGMRVAITFAVAIDPERTLEGIDAPGRRLSWGLWGRTYAEWHTAWAARGGRTAAGTEQYGHKIVWVLEHRYTEPGLRAGLLKGRDRALARVLASSGRSEARYLARLEIREVGSGHTDNGTMWGDHTVAWYEPERTFQEDDPPPASLLGNRYLDDETGPAHIAHRETPRLHLQAVDRHNAWVEQLHTLAGEPADHGPIEVGDGELTPANSLANARPSGARVYEATGNEGASLELQYRHGAIVIWRRNLATLKMLARCGGRLALAREWHERRTREERGDHERGTLDDVLSLWREAHATDGGGEAPQAHQLILEAIEAESAAHLAGRRHERYIDAVARHDLDSGAAQMIARWIRERLDAGEPMEAWTDALGSACASDWRHRPLDGAPALLRALCDAPETTPFAIALVNGRDNAPTTREGVLGLAESMEVEIAERAWWRRRDAAMTSDDIRAKP